VSIIATVAVVLIIALFRISQYKSAEISADSQLLQLQTEYEQLLSESNELTEKLSAVENKNASSQSTLNRQAAVLTQQTSSYQQKLDDFAKKTEDLQKKLDELSKAKEDIINKLKEIPYLPGMDNLQAKAAPPAVHYASDPLQLLDLQLTSLDSAAQFQLQSYTELSASFQEVEPVLSNYPIMWPVTGPVTSVYGYRQSPLGGNGGENHSGIDIAVKTGTPVACTGGGVVKHAGEYGSYGYLVIIDHGMGLETYYAHNSRVLVSSGDTVTRGQIVAKSGSTGYSTGPHVHYEVRINGKAVNPSKYMSLSKS
jgi:murein DD-endopeptidase MepM/ murein hydrolase activator NlpD